MTTYLKLPYCPAYHCVFWNPRQSLISLHCIDFYLLLRWKNSTIVNIECPLPPYYSLRAALLRFLL